MTVDEAVKNYKPRERKELPEADKLLIQKAYELFDMIHKEHAKPEYKDKYIPLSSAFVKFDDSDLSNGCDIISVYAIKDDKVVFYVEEHWAYGGYAEGYATIPIMNLKLSQDDVSRMCLEKAKSHYQHKIADEEKKITYCKEKISEYEAELNALKKIG